MDKNWYEFFEQDRFAVSNGMKLIHIEPGLAVAQLDVEDRHLNAANVVQGGAIFTLADYAFAAASNACGSLTLGINASINYFKPPKGKRIKAKARLVSSSNRLCTYLVDITDEFENLVASFTGTGYMKKST